MLHCTIAKAALSSCSSTNMPWHKSRFFVCFFFGFSESKGDEFTFSLLRNQDTKTTTKMKETPSGGGVTSCSSQREGTKTIRSGIEMKSIDWSPESRHRLSWYSCPKQIQVERKKLNVCVFVFCRCIAIAFPLKRMDWMTVKKAKTRIIPAIVLVNLAYSSYQVFGLTRVDPGILACNSAKGTSMLVSRDGDEFRSSKKGAVCGEKVQRNRRSEADKSSPILNTKETRK